MRNYRDGGSGRGRRSFGDRNSSGDRQMFKTVCSNCSKECEVPFKPTGEKPVYCSECFGKMGNRDNRRSFNRPRYDNRSNADDKYQALMESVNSKLDKILSLLQPATPKKAVKEKASEEIQQPSQ